MDAYESFKAQILKNKLGELRTREKIEFYAKVKEAAYRDEMRKISSESMKEIVPQLVKSSMLRKAISVLSKDEETAEPQKRGEET
jgi:hypothetical protein